MSMKYNLMSLCSRPTRMCIFEAVVEEVFDSESFERAAENRPNLSPLGLGSFFVCI